MVSVLVSVSVPIVHHDITPRLESFPGGVLEGAVVSKVICTPAFGAFFGFCGLATNEGVFAEFLPFDVSAVFISCPFLVLAALLLGLWEYLMEGYLFSFPPRDMVPHVLFDAFERIGLLKGAQPFHLFDFLKAQFEL